MKKYSIILPVHNGGKYLRECVSGILNQTYDDFNLIILDNCSTDGSLQWVQELKDPRITIHTSDVLLSIENSWSRITQIEKGEYMTMIGHDDLLDRNYLQVMDDLIRQYPKASLYQAHFRYIDSEGKVLRKCLPMDEKQEAHEFLARQMTRKIDSTGTGYMMRSKDYDESGGLSSLYENLIFADYELWVTLMLKGYKATALSECFSYRIHKSASAITNGMGYFNAFLRYAGFIQTRAKDNKRIDEVIHQHGYEFLMYYCESLSHRVLKTPVKSRNIRVKDVIRKIENLATQLIPTQRFEPVKKWRVRVAKILDEYSFTRNLFQFFRKIS